MRSRAPVHPAFSRRASPIIGVEKDRPSAKQPAIITDLLKASHLALRPSSPESRADQLAKRDAAQKDVFLREVDEALRQDQVLGAFKRYGVCSGPSILATSISFGTAAAIL